MQPQLRLLRVARPNTFTEDVILELKRQIGRGAIETGNTEENSTTILGVGLPGDWRWSFSASTVFVVVSRYDEDGKLIRTRPIFIDELRPRRWQRQIPYNPIEEDDLEETPTDKVYQ